MRQGAEIALARLHRIAGGAVAAALACLVAAGAVKGQSAAPAEIRVAQPFALELAPRHSDAIAPDDPLLAELLGAAFAGPLALTHDLTAKAKLGVTPLTFTAWSGPAVAGVVSARRTVPLLVLPYGQAPIGISADERATASNNATRVLRDETGTLHLVWLEATEHQHRVMYRRGASRGADGAMAWDGAAEALSDPATTPWNAYVGLAAVRGGVVVAWHGADGVVLRRIVRHSDGWRNEAPVATRIDGGGPEMGPSLVAQEGEIAMLTPAAMLARSRDGGLTWQSEPMPVPGGGKPKNIAMAVDRRGNLHVVFALPINDRHWALRYVRREAAGWTDAQDMLADSPAWQPSSIPGQVLADFPTLRIDHRDGLHIAWHGTANTRTFGQDEVFYRHRPAATGGWEAWRPIQALWPNAGGLSQGSFAPSLSLDQASDTAIAVTFFVNERDYWETGIRMLRDGTLIGERMFLSRKRAEQADMPTMIWFPSAAPTIHRPASGGAWLDVIQTVKLPADFKAPHVIVHQTADIERLVKAAAQTNSGVAVGDLLDDAWPVIAVVASTFVALVVSARMINSLAKRRQRVSAAARSRRSRRRVAQAGEDEAHQRTTAPRSP